ncbi:MAG: hypothetical protein ACTS27_00900 [Phycisphaerales bacterium]
MTIRRRISLSTLLAAAFAALPLAAISVAPTAVAAPEPSPVPVRWQLDVTPGPLRVLKMDVPGEGPRSFFYMPYKVVNNTGEDLYFAPVFELATDEGEILRAGREVPTAAVREAMNRLSNPFMVEPIQAIGTLAQGEENAVESIAIWPAPNLSVDRVSVYAAGFSGETRRIVKPVVIRIASENQDEDGEEASNEVLLRKTLMLVHQTPGELTRTGNTPLTRVEQRWIMR